MQLRYSRYVRSDLDTIWDTIAPHGVFTADAWLDQIEARFAHLLQFPYSAPIHSEIAANARALVVERWLVIYSVTTDSVDIIRVVDGARDLSRLDLPTD